MRKSLLVLAVCLLLTILCFYLLCTDIGHDFILKLFPTADLSENLVIWNIKQKEEFPVDSLPLSEELPGIYMLVEITSPELSLSADKLAAIRSLGIPLELELLEDGSAILSVFDLKTEMAFDADNMLFRTGNADLFFFYRDGVLTVVDGEEHMVFERTPGDDPES